MSKKNKLSKVFMIFGKKLTFLMNFIGFLPQNIIFFDRNHKIYGKLQLISNLETYFHKKNYRSFESKTEIV